MSSSKAEAAVMDWPLESRFPVPHLRAWRRWRGMNQEDLARRAGVAQTCVSQLESVASRTTRATTVQALARALDVPWDALVRYGPQSLEGHRWALREDTELQTAAAL